MNLQGFGATDVTKPYEFIGFGAMDVTKPYEFIGFGAMDVTKPYEFIGFGVPNFGPKPCRLHVSGPKPRSPDLLAPISTPAPDLAHRPYTSFGLTSSAAD